VENKWLDYQDSIYHLSG